MAPPSKEVIDLTGDDDDDDSRQRQRRRRLPFPNVVENGIVGGSTARSTNKEPFVNDADLVSRGGPASYGSAHAHPHRSAPGQTVYHPTDQSPTSFALPPPAKRQKLSEPPRGSLSHEQVIAKSISIHLSPYAKDAVELFKNKGLDEYKLEAEVSLPPQHTHDGSTPLVDGSDNPIVYRSDRPFPENTQPKFAVMGACPHVWLTLSLAARECWLRASLLCR